MNQRQHTMFYHFDIYRDLTYKEQLLKSKIELMEDLGQELLNFIKSETMNYKGDFVHAIDASIEKQEEINALYHEAFRTSMKEQAIRYSEHINDMNGQRLTLYYEVVPMENDLD